MIRFKLLLPMCALMLASGLSANTICANTTDCTLMLTQGNSGSGFGTGDFGTVELSLNTLTDVVTVDVKLAAGFQIINTGFPGSFGFVENWRGVSRSVTSRVPCTVARLVTLPTTSISMGSDMPTMPQPRPVPTQAMGCKR